MTDVTCQDLSDPIGNNLLRALRIRDWGILQAMLEEWSAPTEPVLHNPGDTVRYAWTPRRPALAIAWVGDLTLQVALA